MTTYGWLLFLHITGAFFFLGGSVAAAVFNVSAHTRQRPSEVAALMRMTRVLVPIIGLGSIMTLVFGLWLVHDVGYGYGDGWIAAALILWAVAAGLGGAGGKRERETRVLAERLAAEGDSPSTELRARMRDPATLAMSYGAGIALLVVLVLMIWKPGAG
ncbi:MAG TPA: DUF2269 family protein [Gaiellales bacterium]|nr:DUF2269 family protein [Gaiellales bacterium]